MPISRFAKADLIKVLAAADSFAETLWRDGGQLFFIGISSGDMTQANRGIDAMARATEIGQAVERVTAAIE